MSLSELKARGALSNAQFDPAAHGATVAARLGELTVWQAPGMVFLQWASASGSDFFDVRSGDELQVVYGGMGAAVGMVPIDIYLRCDGYEACVGSWNIDEGSGGSAADVENEARAVLAVATRLTQARLRG